MSPTGLPVSVHLVTSAADRRAAFAIRGVVFQEEQGVPAEIEFDADDDTAFHVLAEVDGEAVGTGRLIVQEKQARIGRMAVFATSRRQGIGTALLERLVDEARRRGVARVILHAQVHAIGMYRRSGFVAVGSEFEEAGITHQTMERRL